MCLQTVRRHLCRHCRTEWTAADFLELCPEGDKCVLKHGYCAPVVQLLEEVGHHVSVGHVILPPLQQRHNNAGGPAHVYPLLQRSPPEATAHGALEDMCDDCKEKHYREWAIEARARAEQQAQQAREQQQQQQQQQHAQQHAQNQAQQAQQHMNGA